MKRIKEEIKEKGYIGFLSNIGKEKSIKIVDRLTEITKFVFWIFKAEMDIELGYYLK